MIFYKIHALGKTLDWAGTQADAKATTKLHQAGFSHDAVEWEEAEVPTDKPTLLAWLKENALGEKKVRRSAETPHLLPPMQPKFNNPYQGNP